ncbi:hypothetical protein [Nissabacter sp. SGAir0207]|uniref:hypothetical protein n=1 Tax=Nissabacter sp. SGAir0207 TaxID=2126321 RepID=UPI0010CCD06D|nr:hypothetical protein [Nissabacter sp. SGAir0207]QCR38775.1 hypothetical protein C1N62_21855 [Nissabacter sp. SGAir0207]
MITLSSSYTPSTITKQFDVIASLIVRGSEYLAIFDSRKPLAAAVQSHISPADGEMRYRVVAMLELAHRDDARKAYAVVRYWEEASYLPAGVITGDTGELATGLYQILARRRGLTFVSY